jgi:hypothetical protein
MSASAVPPRTSGHGWQLILADLALILFLVTLSALPAAEAGSGRRLADRAARGEEVRPAPPAQEIAASQALFRPVKDGPTLAQWLAAQPHDPRATLTVFALHRAGGEAAAWKAASALAAQARAGKVQVRTIISAGDQSDLYASLGYDAAVAGAGAGQ